MNLLSSGVYSYISIRGLIVCTRYLCAGMLVFYRKNPESFDIYRKTAVSIDSSPFVDVEMSVASCLPDQITD